ncbi:MAG: hypothetical protein J5666_02050 [Bacilli bacterium]|nr:hypothetical protein [Bacilli bacterium]
MKKVLLLGDSIRMGYDEFVKANLPEFEVYYDEEDNGRFCSYTIWQFNQLYKKDGPFDIVHFNNGYWDMNHEDPFGEAETPLPDYLHNLKRLIDLIRKTGAIPIFSLTTPIYNISVEEDGFKPTGYKNEWVIEYNEAALKLMQDENVEVIDLYHLLLDGYHYYKCYDSLHLTEEGYQKCAKAISDKIKEMR